MEPRLEPFDRATLDTAFEVHRQLGDFLIEEGRRQAQPTDGYSERRQRVLQGLKDLQAKLQGVRV